MNSRRGLAVTALDEEDCSYISKASVVCGALASILSRLYGPFSCQNLLLVPGKTIIGNNGSAILHSLKIENHLASFILSGIRSYENYAGDGTKSLVIFLDECLSCLSRLHCNSTTGMACHNKDMGRAHNAQVSRAFAEIHETWIPEIIAPHLHRFCCIDAMQFIEGHFRRKGINLEDRTKSTSSFEEAASLILHYVIKASINEFPDALEMPLSKLIVNWIMATLTLQGLQHAKKPWERLEEVVNDLRKNESNLILAVPQGDISSSEVLVSKFYLPKGPLDLHLTSVSHLTKQDNVGFIVARCKFDLKSEGSSTDVVKVSSVCQFDVAVSYRSVRLRALLAPLRAQGIRVLVATEALQDPAGEVLAELGILAVQYAEEEDAALLCARAGIAPVVALAELGGGGPPEACIGHCQRVEITRLMDQQYTVFHGIEAAGSSEPYRGPKSDNGEEDRGGGGGGDDDDPGAREHGGGRRRFLSGRRRRRPGAGAPPPPPPPQLLLRAPTRGAADTHRAQIRRALAAAAAWLAPPPHGERGGGRRRGMGGEGGETAGPASSWAAAMPPLLPGGLAPEVELALLFQELSERAKVIGGEGLQSTKTADGWKDSSKKKGNNISTRFFSSALDDKIDQLLQDSSVSALVFCQVFCILGAAYQKVFITFVKNIDASQSRAFNTFHQIRNLRKMIVTTKEATNTLPGDDGLSGDAPQLVGIVLLQSPAFSSLPGHHHPRSHSSSGEAPREQRRPGGGQRPTAPTPAGAGAPGGHLPPPLGHPLARGLVAPLGPALGRLAAALAFLQQATRVGGVLEGCRRRRRGGVAYAGNVNEEGSGSAVAAGLLRR